MFAFVHIANETPHERFFHFPGDQQLVPRFPLGKLNLDQYGYSLVYTNLNCQLREASR